jgi:hypothetical protein
MTASFPIEAAPALVRGRKAGERAADAQAARVAANAGAKAAVLTTAVAVVMLPVLVPRGPGNATPADLFIAVALGACLLWAGKSHRPWAFPYAVGMWIFMAGGAIGALVGPVPLSGALALVQDLEMLLWCWAVANIAATPERLRTLVSTWSYSSIVWAGLLIIGLLTRTHLLTGQTGSEGSRTALTLYDPNYAASYWFISLMVIWASGVPRRRWLRVLGYCLLLPALISTGSNSGMVALIVGTVVAATFAALRRWGPMAAVATAAFLAIGGFVVASEVSITHIQRWAHGSRYAVIRDGLGRGQASVTERSTLLRESVVLFRDGSPLGEGPVSTKTRLRRMQAPYVKEAHDDYFAALIERGLIGAFGVLLLLSSVAIRTACLAGGRLTDGFHRVLACPHALAGAVAGTLAAETVYELLHVRHVWALFGLVAAVYMWGRR